ncbi:CCA tRNA nucleotidyltransferase [Natronomonas sp. EA1]|uniref:CCA tRNA nucleotidyltransferase n=1 Tax=Natronomonas sp. EA1 TaxID=3421655 RepID=UPI003EBB39B0
MSSFEAVTDEIRARVVPDEAERERLEAVRERVVARTKGAVDELPVAAEVVTVGSTARGTWLAGDRDIDVFVRFPETLERAQLQEYGLEVGHAVLPDGHEEYAEHPYVKGTFEGFDVDLVPCYDVPTASDIRSAVDRTPFHTEYLEARLTPALADDVRVAKAFLKGIGAYGSDLKTAGFAGYLVELLVLEHGGFRAFVEAASEWHPPVEYDPEDHGQKTFDDALVVIDPTDPERNVAASLSTENVARVTHYARALLDEPSVDLFEPWEPEPLTAADVRAEFDARGTHPVAVRFETPDIVEDQLYPQLDRSLAGIEGELDRRGFDVLRSARWADETHAVLVLECEVARRPAVERHDGPPVHVRGHATGFYEKYADGEEYGPYIDADGRYVVERERDHRTPEAFLASDDLYTVALGSTVATCLREEGYDVLAGDEVGELADAFGVELARYVSPRP